MARPKKNSVDYFPHQCISGKTIFILEQKFGNDGYAFWFKLLEILGTKSGHFLDLNSIMEVEFLQAKTRTSDVTTVEILDLLASLAAIDTELWGHKVIWSQNFVDGIKDVYTNRRVGIPARPSFYNSKLIQDVVSTSESTQSKVKESKVNKTKRGVKFSEDGLAVEFKDGSSQKLGMSQQQRFKEGDYQPHYITQGEIE